MIVLAISPVLLLGVVLAANGAGAQTESPGVAGSKGANSVEQFYAHAKPYIDGPLRDLKQEVPALDGLRADSSQSSLESVLRRTSEVMGTLLPKMPFLAARETVSQMQITVPPRGGTQDGVTFIGRGRDSSQPSTDERQLEDRLHMSLLTGASFQEFDYLIQSRQSTEGTILQEWRTGLHGRPSDEQQTLHGIGFGHVWLLFLPQNIPESRYRFLGQQKMNGHEAYVVAFAQLPDHVRIPAEINVGTGVYPLLYQGIAWIDKATFRIVRLQTDMLAPLPIISVERMRSDLLFSEVRIAELNQFLWLPKQVELTWRQGNLLLGELHVYTKYRLFKATVRILPQS